MTITVQVAGLRQSLESAEPQQVSDFIALTTPSKVLMDITPDNVVALSREGTSLLLEQMDGGTLEVLGFFNGSGQSQLYLPSEEGELLMASMTTAPGSSSLSTIFVAATDEALRFDPDALLAEAEQASPSEAPAAQEWWEDDEVAEEDVAAEVAAGEPEAAAMADDGIDIEEVFLDDEAHAEAEPAREETATLAESGWLDGIGPDLMGFLAFGAGLGARAAHNQSSSSSSSRSEDAEAAGDEEEAHDDGTQVAAADGELSQEESEALLLQEDEDLLVLDGEEDAEEAAMAAAPASDEPADMPEFASLSDAFGSAEELAAVGPEVMA